MEKKKVIHELFAGGTLITATVFYMLTSSINPWSRVLPHLDSAVWLRCGVEMVQGKTMYVDMWDHKGPVMFLFQWIGLSLTPHSLNGLWLLECIACFASMYFMYKIAKIISEDFLVQMLAVVTSFQLLYYFGGEGNCVEQWALPFICSSLYFFVRYLYTKQRLNWQICIAGAGMACAFLINGNLISVWCAYVPLLLLLFIAQKKYKDMQSSIVWFLIGFMFIMGITALVLGFQGALDKFLNIYFGFNSDYVSGNSLSNFKNLVLNTIYQDKWFAYVQFLGMVSLINKWNWKDWKWSSFLFTIVAIIMSNMSPRGYNHYYIQLIPCMIVPATLLFEELLCWCKNKKIFYGATLVWFLLFGRFLMMEFYDNKILTIVGANNDMYMAGGNTENYTIVNEWLGHPWSEEDIDKWVTNEIY